jgi:hypothetical protein
MRTVKGSLGHSLLKYTKGTKRHVMSDEEQLNSRCCDLYPAVKDSAFVGAGPRYLHTSDEKREQTSSFRLKT